MYANSHNSFKMVALMVTNNLSYFCEAMSSTASMILNEKITPTLDSGVPFLPFFFFFS